MFAQRLERRRSLVLAALVIALILIAILVVAYRRDDHPGARLVVRRAGVARAVGEVQRPVLGIQRVSVGEVIHTDDGGRAQLDYFDGSVTHVDSQTTFKVIDLLDRPDRITIAGKLDGGRIWNRVSTMERTQDRFEVRIPKAWVTARGTSNIIDCRAAPACTVIGISEITEVVIDGGETVLLASGECTTVDAEGKRADCSFPRDELCADEFAVAALHAEGLSWRCLEEGVSEGPEGAESTPAPGSPSPGPTPTPSPEPAGPARLVPTRTAEPTPASEGTTSGPLTSDVDSPESG